MKITFEEKEVQKKILDIPDGSQLGIFLNTLDIIGLKYEFRKKDDVVRIKLDNENPKFIVPYIVYFKYPGYCRISYETFIKNS
tara:strand:- start:738 stop:986 length:249 start_codon:yes stop_codon:yes gene_type:complete